MKPEVNANETITLRPVIIPAGIWLGPPAVASAALRACRIRNQVPPEIQRAINANLFWDNAEAGLLPEKYPAFTDLGAFEAQFLRLAENWHQNPVHVLRNFTGNLVRLDDGLPSEKVEIKLAHSPVICVETCCDCMDPFTAAYGNLGEIEYEFSQLLRGFLGNDFPYRENVVRVTGIAQI